MRNNHMFRWFYVAFFITFLFSSCTDGKGFGGGRGGGGFKGGGSRTGFSGSSGSNRIGNYGNYNRPRSGSSFRSNAMSFGAGAVGGIAAYSLMRSMSGSYHGGPGYYDRGYGGGETCVNNEDLNGTRFGQFRCPLNGFPIEARHCCGEYGKQYCCIRETTRSSGFNYWNLLWLILGLLILFAIILYFLKRRQQREKNFYGVPVDITATEQQEPAFYQPQPPPMGYPPPPMGYPQPAGYPYAVPPQNYEGNFNPYAQQQMAYPPQQQMPYPPQQQTAYPPQQQMAYPPQQQVPYPTQQQSYNPYQVKEVAPPGYDDAIRNNQTKPI